MKIFSKTRDYYDVCQQFGTDDSLHFIRNEDKVGVPKSLKGYEVGSVAHRNKKYPYGHNLYWMVDKIWIGFCGQMHFGVVGNNYIAWNEDAIEVLKEVYQTTQKFLEGYYKKLFDTIQNQINTRTVEPFIELDCPIFLLRKNNTNAFIVKNPCLRNFGFEKVKDPYTAYQEISMFIGNELAKQVDPQPLSDKDRLIAHGMDPVWSFRNPDKPKRKQK
jgi:hypothetical protein